MTINAAGELMIAGVVQLLDSTGGWPVVKHLHRFGPQGEDFEWLEFPQAGKAMGGTPMPREDGR